MIPLWNVYSFFVTYANIDQYDPRTAAPPVERRPELDRWIVSELNSLIAVVTGALDGYEPDVACRGIESFVEYLSNWYVRRSRRRFWKSGVLGQADGRDDEDKLSAYATLYECLTTLTRLVAPFIPFMAEAMYQNLSAPLNTGLVGSVGGGCESVHLKSYPVADASRVDERLSEATRLAMRLSSLGRGARSKAGLKVRQPLAEAVVSLPTEAERAYLAEIDEQLRDELNVKAIKDASEVGGRVRFEVRPNLPVLGPKYGGELASIREQLAGMDASDIALKVERGQQIQLEGSALLPDEVLVEQYPLEGYSAASEAGYAVAVTTEVSHELALEGLARELVHRIQGMRRSAGFEIADRIVTYYRGPDELDEVVAAHGDYIKKETLSSELLKGDSPEGAYVESEKVNGLQVMLALRREQL